MSKFVESDIKPFTGKVYLPDFLTLPQVLAFTRAQDNVFEGMKKWDRDEIMLPAILACVEHFEINKQPEHPTLETFCFTPSPQADELIALLITKITSMILQEEEIPNG